MAMLEEKREKYKGNNRRIEKKNEKEEDESKGSIGKRAKEKK